jgi:hypothetical protein
MWLEVKSPMGDSGEGLVDAEARIQERMEEMQLEREQAQRRPRVNVEQTRKLESLKLAHKELSRQLESSAHAARKQQLSAAIADIEKKMAELR